MKTNNAKKVLELGAGHEIQYFLYQMELK